MIAMASCPVHTVNLFVGRHQYRVYLTQEGLRRQEPAVIETKDRSYPATRLISLDELATIFQAARRSRRS